MTETKNMNTYGFERPKPSLVKLKRSHPCPRCGDNEQFVYTRPSIKYGNVYYCSTCDMGGPAPDKPDRSDGHFYVGRSGVKETRWQ